MTPKFKLGESVIIVCPYLPQFDGTEHTITDIKLVTFSDHNNIKLLCYELGFSYEWQGDKNYRYWREGCFRKRHDKGDMSYKELMNSLKSPVLEWK